MQYDVDVFEHAEFIAPGRTDDFFKWLLAQDWGSEAEETGDVQAPNGYVMLFKVTPGLVAEYVTESGDSWVSGWKHGEWYLVQQTNRGIVFAHEYASEYAAKVDFITAGRAYEAWEQS